MNAVRISDPSSPSKEPGGAWNREAEEKEAPLTARVLQGGHPTSWASLLFSCQRALSALPGRGPNHLKRARALVRA